MDRTHWLRLAACAALIVVALTLYWPATTAWFYEDDLQWLAGTLTFEPAGLFDVSAQQHFFRPVIALYFWAATPLFDGSPVSFHWANHVLHAANALLVLLLAGAVGFRPRLAFFAALLFVSMPAYVEAITWVSALAEPVTTFFGILSVYGVLRARREGKSGWTLLAVVGFALALMTHESAVVLLPLLVLADWAFVPEPGGARPPLWTAPVARLRRFAPYILLLAIYLAADLAVNRRNYLVEEGHYRIGLHAVENALGYVVTLYAGKRNLVSFIGVGIVLALLLLRGTPRVIVASAWLLLTILPFAFFTWETTSRYAYMPAVGMALLLTEALLWLEGWLARWMTARARIAFVSLLGAFLAVRFMLFAAENIENFTPRTERFRQLAAAIRERHPDPPPDAQIAVDAGTIETFQFRYVEALVRWEFRDPTLTLVVGP